MLVRLGKAVPADSDTPSLLTQVDGISNRAGTQLDGVTLSGDSSGATAATPPPVTTTDPTAAATEATAALLPLGASVGPAGLSVMPYDVDFSGDYFQAANGGLDGLVHLQKPKHSADTAEFSDPRPSGRLVTINSFSLTTETSDATPTTALQGTLSMTTYLAPADQGLTGGATTTLPGPRRRDAHALRQRGPGRGDGDAMKTPKMPSALTDLYRDLRDRHLLIVVVGLLVAIVAVPFALAKSPDTTVPVPTPNPTPVRPT